MGFTMIKEGSTGLDHSDTSSGVWSRDRALALTFFDLGRYEKN